MTNTKDTIRHLATITKIEGNTLHVKMLQSSACSGCHAAKLCQSSETKEKEVDVTTTTPEQYQPGQQVMLLGSVRQGLKATIWAYMIPVALLVVVLCVCTKLGLSEILSALCSIGTLAIYFFVLYLCRDKFQQSFSFSVRSLNQTL